MNEKCIYTGGENSDLRPSINFGKVGDGGASIRKPFAGQAQMHTGNLRNLIPHLVEAYK